MRFESYSFESIFFVRFEVGAWANTELFLWCNFRVDCLKIEQLLLQQSCTVVHLRISLAFRVNSSSEELCSGAQEETGDRIGSPDAVENLSGSAMSDCNEWESEAG